MKHSEKNPMKNWKNNLLRGLAVLLVAMLLTAMTACTEREINTVIDVIGIAGDLAASDGTTTDDASPSEGQDEAESKPESQSSGEAQNEAESKVDSGAQSSPKSTASPARQTEQPEAETETIDEDGSYTTKEDVALYLHTYGHLPSNFITKKEAEKLGWPGGNLEPYAPGKCIGGSHYGNYEGLLPDKKGRSYTECDIDTLGAKKRGAKRIIFSNDGLIYYTADHYETFELLYGEP